MLADLAAVVEDLDVPFDGESLEQAIALRDRLDARIAQAAGTFEANGWWAGDASASFVAWLRAHAKMTRPHDRRRREPAMGYWLARNRPEPSEPKEPERSLYLSATLDDRWVLNGSLDAEAVRLWPRR